MTSGTFQHSAAVESFVKNEIYKVCGYMPVIKASKRQQSAATPFPIKANSDGKTITDEEHAMLLQNREYRTVYYAMRGADRERKQWARRLHRCKDYATTKRRQREAKQRYIDFLGEWVRLLENFLQINERK